MKIDQEQVQLMKAPRGRWSRPIHIRPKGLARKKLGTDLDRNCAIHGTLLQLYP